MSKPSIRRYFVVALVVASAFAALPAAAQIQIKACFETVHKRCCEVASGVELTVTCSEGDYTWICVGSISQNNLITTTQASSSGLRYSVNAGTDECKYTKPACGSTLGSCVRGEEAAATCQIKAAGGPLCVSPVFAFADADGDGGVAAVTASCSDK